MKENTKGTPEVEKTDLHFVHGKQSVDVSASSIESVSTGANSQAAVGKTVSTLSTAALYGSGWVLALFRTNINTLTIQYRDSAGVLHGDIFTLPTGTAESVKRELISLGAHTPPGELSDASTIPSVSLRKGEVMHRVLATAVPRCLSTFILAALPLSAEKTRRAQIKVAAIEVAMIESDEIPLPAEFLVALYENLIHQLEKQGFSAVYRPGDRNAATVDDRVVLHSIVRGFKRGSETERKVTTVAGATSITVHCQFTRPDGTPVLERDIALNVRFFGANLRQHMNLRERRLM